MPHKNKNILRDKISGLITNDQTHIYINFLVFYENYQIIINCILGNLEITAEEKVPLDQQNFILRGSNLRNTGWIIGVAAYTG